MPDVAQQTRGARRTCHSAAGASPETSWDVACGSFLDERIGLRVGENEKQVIFWRRERTVLVHREPTGGAGFPIEAPRYEMRLERGLNWKV